MKHISTFQEAQFRRSVDRALERVKTILDTTRHPRLAHQDEEPHTYDDKFALTEFLVNTSIASKMNALERLGLSSDKLKTASDWVHNEQKSVTLRMQAEDFCTFLKDRMVEVPSNVGREVTTTTTSTATGSFLGMGSKTETTKTAVTTKVKEHHWKVGMRYRFILFKGSSPDDPENILELQSRSASTILITSGGIGNSRPTHPIAERTSHSPLDVNLTWFFQRISPTEQSCQFVIERNTVEASKTCKTPRRNPEVDAAVEFDRALYDFSRRVVNFFLDRVEADIASKHNPAVEQRETAAKHFEINSIAVICGLQKEPTFNGKQVKVMEFLSEQGRYRVDPVDPKAGLPPTLLIKPNNLEPSSQQPSSSTALTKKTPQSSPPLGDLDHDAIFAPILPLMENGAILSSDDVAAFLGEQTRSMDQEIDNLTQIYPPRQLMKLVSVAEATVVLVCQHLARLTQQCQESLDYVEDMLKQQLIQAIGKEVAAKDFEQFMRFREQQIFGPTFAPQPFSYAVRRPNHFPDGMLSIESLDAEKKKEPIETWTRRISGAPPMSMPINAATSVELGGDRCLHGWLQHRFKSQSRSRQSFQLAARARQFSSFLLIIGTIAGPNLIDPKDAIILQNKDEILIPLLTNTLPSAKEFKDAIASLSPEQQSFAKAFRAMQLESSVFAVCVVQLKPQLERLLGLPNGSLTKEIQLTQDLMSLFVEYQIPSDLLTYEGDEGSTLDKVAAVKGYVKAVMDVIEGEQKKQLEHEVMVSDMKAEMAFSATAYAGGGGAPLSSPEMMLANTTSMDTDGMGIMPEGAELSMSSLGSKLRSPRKKKALASTPHRMLAGAMPETARKPSSRRLVRENSRQRKQVARGSSNSSLKGVDTSRDFGSLNDKSTDGVEDFTRIPKVLDSKVESFDADNSLRTTIIKASQEWTRVRQPNLLSPVASAGLGSQDIEGEKKKAFDLLDAISRSGTLPIDFAEVHVLVGLSHCFENDVMGTIIQDNINPIEKVEKSALLLASTIHGKGPAEILAGDAEVQRLTGSFPEILSSPSADGGEIYQD